MSPSYLFKSNVFNPAITTEFCGNPFIKDNYYRGMSEVPNVGNYRFDKVTEFKYLGTMSLMIIILILKSTTDCCWPTDVTMA
jgi:hypothetical protein